MYYKVRITCTSKSFLHTDDYRIFDNQNHDFKTLDDVKNFLRDTYGNCKKQKMYRGEGEHIGYIYCFNNKDVSHDSKSWHQQDWVEITEVEEKKVLL